MSAGDPPMKVLLDEGTPSAVSAPFLARSYEVIFHRSILESGVEDRYVVAAAIINKAVLVAVVGCQTA